MTSEPSLFVIATLVAVGLVMGSFLATLAIRLPEGRSVVLDRSRCDGCGVTLGPWQLIPLVSWIIQKGRCHSCGARISAFYPTMEVAAAVIAVWAVSTSPSEVLPFTLLLGWALLALSVMDIRCLRLSDALTLPLVVIGLASAWCLWPDSFSDHVIGAFAAAGSIGMIAALYRYVRRRPGLGMGDVKLSAAAGAWLGYQSFPSAVLIASSAALLVIFVLRSLGRKIAWDTKIAFGSFLCLGTWIVWLYGPIAWG